MLFFGIVLLALLSLPLVMALKALGSAQRLALDIASLSRRLELAEAALARGETTEPAAEAAPPPEREPAPDNAAEEPEAPPTEPPAPDDPPPQAMDPILSSDLERRLTEKWMVWGGSIALALGGIFLVKYSIEQGLLSPAIRVVLALVLGIGLVVFGETLSRRPEKPLPLPIGPDQVPPALVSAGLATCYGALWAASELYHLIPPLVGFAALACIAAAGFALALRHGRLVAIIGILGAYAVPALVDTGSANAAGLFGYLLLPTAASLAVLRWLAWPWLAYLVMAATAVWSGLWCGLSFQGGDEWVLGGFHLIVLALFAAFRLGLPWPPFRHRIDDVRVANLTLAATAVSAAGIVEIFLASRAADGALLALGALVAASFALARADDELDAAPSIVATAGSLMLAVWWLPARDIMAFSGTATGLAIAVAAGGFAGCWRAARPARWAMTSAAMPIVALLLAHWRLPHLLGSVGWTALSLAVAGAAVAAADRVARQRQRRGMEEVLATYAVAACAALVLAAAFALERAWLTVSLALLAALVAWVHGRLGVPVLRFVVLGLAAAVTIRLTLNPEVLRYPVGRLPVFNWLLYGYGVPAVALVVAARLLRRHATDAAVYLCEGAAFELTVLLVTLQIRHFATDGDLRAFSYGLGEAATHAVAWLAMALGALTMDRHRPSTTMRIGGRILLGLATGHFVLIELLEANPLFTRQDVGEWPLLNLLLAAYALPACLLAVAARQAPAAVRTPIGLLALVLGFVWITLETRHGFVGSVLHWRGKTSDAELYGYSAAWLVYAAALLAGGIRFGNRRLRQAGLAVLLVVSAKVFLVDMAQLHGIWRALSFLGLGGSLVGIGLLYRRFVTRAPGAGENTVPPG